MARAFSDADHETDGPRARLSASADPTRPESTPRIVERGARRLEYAARLATRRRRFGRAARRTPARAMIDELQAAKVARALTSERQLQEVMVDFWDNHFSIFAGKGAPERYLLASFERDAIRPNALGKFRDLLGAVAKSPAMLYYLDNWESTVEPDRPALSTFTARPVRGRLGVAFRPAPGPRRNGLNENYGRELLELHTL